VSSDVRDTCSNIITCVKEKRTTKMERRELGGRRLWKIYKKKKKKINIR